MEQAPHQLRKLLLSNGILSVLAGFARVLQKEAAWLDCVEGSAGATCPGSVPGAQMGSNERPDFCGQVRQWHRWL